MNNFFIQLQQALAKKNPLYIKVKVVPKSPKNEIVEVSARGGSASGGMADGTYKIRIAAPAEGGKANAELIRFLKKSLGLSEATIVSGKTDRIKLIKLKR